MKEFLNESVFFGVAISVLTYEIGVLLKKKLKLDIINPLLVSIVAVILFLLAFQIPYEKYNEGAKYISYLLTPATVCLAIPLYEQVELLKKNVKAILAGLLSGVVTSVLCVLVLSYLFHLDPKVHHDGDWNGCFGGTWRLCDDYRGGDCRHGSARQCDCRGGMQTV